MWVVLQLNYVDTDGTTPGGVQKIPVKQNYKEVVSMAVDWMTGNVYMVHPYRYASKNSFSYFMLLRTAPVVCMT